MAKDLNKVMLTGRLGADPELRYTPSGAAVVNFRVASNRTFGSQGGERQEETEWFKVVAWETLAERINRWLAKGDRVYVEGRLQTRRWERGGVPQYTLEVVASDVIFLEVKRPGHSIDDTPAAPDDEEAPPPPEAQRPSAGPRGNYSLGARVARERREQDAPRIPYFKEVINYRRWMLEAQRTGNDDQAERWRRMIVYRERKLKEAAGELPTEGGQGDSTTTG